MSIKLGASIVTKDLIFYLNASNQQNYILSEVEVLVVAGGGAGGGYGGNDGAGGGGAGGLIYSSSYPTTPGSAISVTVGNGGSGVGNAIRGNDGQNSVFGVLTAIGGGGGGTEGSLRDGKPGGSGGGAGGYGVKPGGAGTAGQGFAGGNCTAPGDGGGGGAGAVGQNGLTGTGGIGLLFNISGTPTYYAGGGGASGDKRNVRGGSGALGGFGGGGKGQDATNSIPPENGTNGLGGGGGAAAGSNPSFGAGTTLTSGAGGSGVVIVRYPGPQKATGGNTITQVGGYTIHTFTSTGTFTPLTVPVNGGVVYGLQDLSGNNNTITQSGGVTYSTANGGALVFDGINDYLATSATVEASTNSNLQTICGWMIGDGALFGSNANGIGQFHLRVSLSSNVLTYRVSYFGGIGGEVDDTVSVTSRSANNIVIVKTAAEKYDVYFNAEKVLSQVTKKATVSVNFYPGYYYSGVSWNGGTVSNYLIYNRALTAAEIQQNYNAQRGRFGV